MKNNKSLFLLLIVLVIPIFFSMNVSGQTIYMKSEMIPVSSFGMGEYYVVENADIHFSYPNTTSLTQLCYTFLNSQLSGCSGSGYSSASVGSLSINGNTRATVTSSLKTTQRPFDFRIGKRSYHSDPQYEINYNGTIINQKIYISAGFGTSGNDGVIGHYYNIDFIDPNFPAPSPFQNLNSSYTSVVNSTAGETTYTYFNFSDFGYDVESSNYDLSCVLIPSSTYTNILRPTDQCRQVGDGWDGIIDFYNGFGHGFNVDADLQRLDDETWRVRHTSGTGFYRMGIRVGTEDSLRYEYFMMYFEDEGQDVILEESIPPYQTASFGSQYLEIDSLNDVTDSYSIDLKQGFTNYNNLFVTLPTSYGSTILTKGDTKNITIGSISYEATLSLDYVLSVEHFSGSYNYTPFVFASNENETISTTFSVYVNDLSSFPSLSYDNTLFNYYEEMTDTQLNNVDSFVLYDMDYHFSNWLDYKIELFDGEESVGIYLYGDMEEVVEDKFKINLSNEITIYDVEDFFNYNIELTVIGHEEQFFFSDYSMEIFELFVPPEFEQIASFSYFEYYLYEYQLGTGINEVLFLLNDFFTGWDTFIVNIYDGETLIESVEQNEIEYITNFYDLNTNNNRLRIENISGFGEITFELIVYDEENNNITNTFDVIITELEDEFIGINYYLEPTGTPFNFSEHGWISGQPFEQHSINLDTHFDNIDWFYIYGWDIEGGFEAFFNDTDAGMWIPLQKMYERTMFGEPINRLYSVINHMIVPDHNVIVYEIQDLRYVQPIPWEDFVGFGFPIEIEPNVFEDEFYPVIPISLGGIDRDEAVPNFEINVDNREETFVIDIIDLYNGSGDINELGEYQRIISNVRLFYEMKLDGDFNNQIIYLDIPHYAQISNPLGLKEFFYVEDGYILYDDGLLSYNTTVLESDHTSVYGEAEPYNSTHYYKIINYFPYELYTVNDGEGITLNDFNFLGGGLYEYDDDYFNVIADVLTGYVYIEDKGTFHITNVDNTQLRYFNYAVTPYVLTTWGHCDYNNQTEEYCDFQESYYEVLDTGRIKTFTEDIDLVPPPTVPSNDDGFFSKLFPPSEELSGMQKFGRVFGVLLFIVIMGVVFGMDKPEYRGIVIPVFSAIIVLTFIFFVFIGYIAWWILLLTALIGVGMLGGSIYRRMGGGTPPT